jgi:hypothetical protein
MQAYEVNLQTSEKGELMIPRDIQQILKERRKTRVILLLEMSRRKIKESSLEILSGMSLGELKALADAILAPGRQRRLNALLRKNKTTALRKKESEELDELLEESDRIALLKAKAQYTLLQTKRTREPAI